MLCLKKSLKSEKLIPQRIQPLNEVTIDEPSLKHPSMLSFRLFRRMIDKLI